MAKIDLHDAYRYCKEHIPMFAEKEAIALDLIDRMRCPLFQTDLYDEMDGAMADYCDEHDLDYDKLVDDGELEIEEIFWAGDDEEV